MLVFFKIFVIIASGTSSSEVTATTRSLYPIALANPQAYVIAFFSSSLAFFF